ncbi:DUF962 domain-containing protein [bacterium]|nr:DUF962 domain-containing protein [bacterium]
MSNYELYHQHPLNKAIHFICIPMIVLTSMNFLNNMYICSLKTKYGYDLEWDLRGILLFIYSIYYISISWYTGFIMTIFMMTMSYLSDYWQKKDKHWIVNSFKVFILAWILQFVGHYIEGVRPALVDSLSSTLFEAPLFSLNYIVPLLEN